ncbi:hypothetical protein [Actinomadura sediminis]|uniref:Uncharacterized protein n=1 Tax=Actinomadura sediminis TaxID=1038904 RepID=A0ABW3EPT4_9ACTN
MESRSSRNMAVIAAAAATLAAAAVAIPADGVTRQDSATGIATPDHMKTATPDHMKIATPDHMF